jgi:hypothetical protein
MKKILATTRISTAALSLAILAMTAVQTGAPPGRRDTKACSSPNHDCECVAGPDGWICRQI